MVSRSSDLGGFSDFDCFAALSQIQADPARIHDCNHERGSWEISRLAGQGVGGGEIVARYSPNTADTAAGVDKNRRRRQADEGYQESILDQVLALFVLQESAQSTHDLILPGSLLEPQDDFSLWPGCSTVMVPFS